MKALIVVPFSLFFSSLLWANQPPPVVASSDAIQTLRNAATRTTVMLNNQQYEVPQAASQGRTLLKSPGAFSVPAPRLQITPGMVVRQTATGRNAKVTGRFSVLFKPGVNVAVFIRQYGLTARPHTGKSRLYQLKAQEKADLLVLSAALKEAAETEAVKLELVSNLMTPL